MGQKVGLDSSLFIYLIEQNPQYFEQVKRIFSDIQADKLEGLFANIGLIEVLTGPKQAEEYELVHEYRTLINDFPNLTITELNEPVIDIASDLRAQYNIAVPDAIHIASAIVYGADVFITNDKALKKVKEIAIQLL